MFILHLLYMFQDISKIEKKILSKVNMPPMPKYFKTQKENPVISDVDPHFAKFGMKCH